MMTLLPCRRWMQLYQRGAAGRSLARSRQQRLCRAVLQALREQSHEARLQRGCQELADLHRLRVLWGRWAWRVQQPDLLLPCKPPDGVHVRACTCMSVMCVCAYMCLVMCCNDVVSAACHYLCCRLDEAVLSTACTGQNKRRLGTVLTGRQLKMPASCSSHASKSLCCCTITGGPQGVTSALQGAGRWRRRRCSMPAAWLQQRCTAWPHMRSRAGSTGRRPEC
jgi:hypothetical protein